MIRGALLFAFFITMVSCNMFSKKKAQARNIAGNWLILYPDHQLKNAKQREAYSRAVQDSIVTLFGLKMISFNEDGSCRQIDSVWQNQGKWHLDAENGNFFIRDAGRGLEFFKGVLQGIRKDTMRIAEMVELNGETITLIWHLKRIQGEYSELFEENKNDWRRPRPLGREQLREKVRIMLNYYSNYYAMVSKESIYFLPSRVFLPFKYYQHAMGLRPFDTASNFSRLFNSTQQAREAYNLVEEAMNKMKGERFPSGKNFVIEYAEFLERLAKQL